MKKYVDDFIDFGPGRQFHPSGIHIEYYKPLKQQVNILREDMFHVAYGDEAHGYSIDVGWYGQSFSRNGCFKVHLVKDDWNSPLISISCKSIKRLVPAIRVCLTRLKSDTDNFYLLPLTEQ
jgi:hypothetical protein